MTCDIWNTDYKCDKWQSEIMTIFVTWQLRVTLDSIRNSCDVFLHKFTLKQFFVSPFMCVWTVLFKGVDEAGEHEKDNADDDEDNSQLFPGLVKRVEEALKTREVSDHLEDAKDPQNPDLLNFFAKTWRGQEYKPSESCCRPCWSSACFQDLSNNFWIFSPGVFGLAGI